MGNKIFYAEILVVSTFLGGIGQLLFKMGLLSSTSLLLGTLLILGLIAYGLSTLLYFYILGRTHLAWAYGFGGLSYIFATIFAVLILGEQVSILRWTGIGLIAVGVALIGFS
jgi:uncharacterized membrane protein